MDIIYTIGTILGVAGTLIFRDWRDGKNLFKKAESPDVPQWVSMLTEHFNHDLTNQNEKIIEKLESIHDCLKKANIRLDEMKEYGVKMREL